MTWIVERLVLWYHQWSAGDWNETMRASEWSREEWVRWWTTEMATARVETELMWLRDLQNPNIFQDQEEAGGLCDPRFRSLLISGLESIGE